MAFKIEARNSGFELTLPAGGREVSVFPMRPSRIEPELREGLWLVLLVAVWSQPDRVALESFVSQAEKWPSGLKLGARLFDDFTESEAWCPGINRVVGSPIYVLIENGGARGHLVGLHSVEEISKWLLSTPNG